LLAGPVDLGAAEAPEQRIGERRRVSGAVAERLPDGLALGLELPANLTPFVPGLRELLDADFRVPRASVGDGVADDAVGYGQPLAVHFRRDVEDVVVTLLRLPDRLGHVRHVHEGAGIEVRPVVFRNSLRLMRALRAMVVSSPRRSASAPPPPTSRRPRRSGPERPWRTCP